MSRVLFIIGVLCLLGLFIFPLWQIELEAPQYPEQPLGMMIHINKITDKNPNDIQNINLMNHYVGMDEIPTTMKEFTIFPLAIISIVLLGLIIGIINKKYLFFLWIILFLLMGVAGIYDFYLWEYEYGHNLNPNAAIKFEEMAYQPPLIGSKTILNFVATSLPASGAYIMFIGVILTFIGFLLAKNNNNKISN